MGAILTGVVEGVVISLPVLESESESESLESLPLELELEFMPVVDSGDSEFFSSWIPLKKIKVRMTTLKIPDKFKLTLKLHVSVHRLWKTGIKNT